MIKNKLKEYIASLEQFNKTINLISKNETIDMNNFHIQVSIELAEFLKHRFDHNITVHDLGSGNGLPGIIIGIYGFQTFLYEIDKRKRAFLDLTIAKLKVNAKTKSDYKTEKSFDGIITVKGLDSIHNIIQNIYIHIHENTSICFLKGNNFRKELELALKYWIFDYNIHESDMFDVFIIEINNIRKK